jgi:MerR family copper efflux transcriptional regulator
MDTLLISQVAERTGFSPSTLRYYEDIGLLPEPDRNSSGYRVYGSDDLEALRFIDRGKRLGLDLEEIADVLQLWRTGDCGPTRDHVEALLHAKLAQVHRDLAELEAFQQQLADAYQRLTSLPVPDVCGPDCGCPPRLEPPDAGRHQLPVHDGGASCTLDSDQARRRQAAWHRLATDALVARDHRGDGSVVLRFTGDDATEARVRELADLEQGCCSFLDMTVTRDHDHVVLHATAPDSHRDYLDLLVDASQPA